MQYPFFDFLRSTLIPELRTDVSASTASHAHFILITVSAFRTFPDKLMAVFIFDNLDFSVISAFHTVITLRIQFRINGNALVIAGPGAGKTECMCQNVLYAIGEMVENGADPIEALHSFLLITFTEAGANEMKGRLTFRLLTQGIEVNGKNRKIAASTDDVKAMTFNSYAFDIDKMFWQELGYSKELAVIENTERGAIIQDLLTDNPIDGLRYENAVARGGAILFVGKCFEFLKSRKVDLEKAGIADTLREEFYSENTMSGIDKKEPDWSGIVDLFDDYCECLKAEGLMEFADQEPAALKMIDAHPEILTNLGYSHIIADEFQDSSPLQMEFMKRFAKSDIVKNGGSLMAVGDDFQSIYGFRDADPDNMLKFYERLDETGKIFFLTDNYRSVQSVVNFGNRVIARNVNKVDKVITTTREEGNPVILKPFYRNETELKYIAWKIKLLIEKQGVAPEDIAFLSYRRLTVQKMAAILTEINVPVVVKIPTSVAEDPNVVAVEALSKAIEEPGSTELYLQYLVAKYNGRCLFFHTTLWDFPHLAFRHPETEYRSHLQIGSPHSPRQHRKEKI